jgi:hypothetical protein
MSRKKAITRFFWTAIGIEAAQLGFGGYLLGKTIEGIVGNLSQEQQFYQQVLEYLNNAPAYKTVLSQFPGIETPIIIPSQYRNNVLCCFSADSLSLSRIVHPVTGNVTFTTIGAYPELVVNTVNEKTGWHWKCMNLSRPCAENGNMHPDDMLGIHQLGNSDIITTLTNFSGFVILGKSFNGNNWREIVPSIVSLLQDEKIIENPQSANPDEVKRLWNAFFAEKKHYGDNDSLLLGLLYKINLQRIANRYPPIAVLDILPFDYGLSQRLPFTPLDGNNPTGENSVILSDSNAKKAAHVLTISIADELRRAANLHPQISPHAFARNGLEGEVDDSGHATAKGHADTANRMLSLVVASDDDVSLAQQGIVVNR